MERYNEDLDRRDELAQSQMQAVEDAIDADSEAPGQGRSGSIATELEDIDALLSTGPSNPDGERIEHVRIGLQQDLVLKGLGKMYEAIQASHGTNGVEGLRYHRDIPEVDPQDLGGDLPYSPGTAERQAERYQEVGLLDASYELTDAGLLLLDGAESLENIIAKENGREQVIGDLVEQFKAMDLADTEAEALELINKDVVEQRLAERRGGGATEQCGEVFRQLAENKLPSFLLYSEHGHLPAGTVAESIGLTASSVSNYVHEWVHDNVGPELMYRNEDGDLELTGIGEGVKAMVDHQYTTIRGTAEIQYEVITQQVEVAEAVGENPAQYLSPEFDTTFVEMIAKEHDTCLSEYVTDRR